MSARVFVAALGLACVPLGCADCLGAEFDRMRLRAEGAAGSGAASSSASAGGGDAGGEGGGCARGQEVECYEGPAATEGVGMCKGGLRSCSGPCVGQVLPAPLEDTATLGDDNCDERTGNHVWSRLGGGLGDQVPDDVAIDPDGNIIVVGRFQGALDFGPNTEPLVSGGGYDAFVVKLAPGGEALWARRYGTSSTEVAEAVALDSVGNIFVTGEFADMPTDFGAGELVSAGGYDIFVVKLDPDGQTLWSKGFGGADHEWAYDIAHDGAGGIVLTGTFYGELAFGDASTMLDAGADQDIFVARLDASGAHVHSAMFGAEGQDVGQGIATDAAGNVLVVGTFEDTVSFGGPPISSGGSPSTFALKLDPAGGHVYSTRLGPTEHYKAGRVISGDGGLGAVVAAALEGPVQLGQATYTSADAADVLVVRLDESGNPVWGTVFGGPEHQAPTALGVDGYGDVTVTGYFFGSIDFGAGAITSLGGMDAFVTKLDGDGKLAWFRTIGDTGKQVGVGLDFDPAGEVVVVGSSQGQPSWGGPPLVSAGGVDIALARYAR